MGVGVGMTRWDADFECSMEGFGVGLAEERGEMVEGRMAYLFGLGGGEPAHRPIGAEGWFEGGEGGFGGGVGCWYLQSFLICHGGIGENLGTDEGELWGTNPSFLDSVLRELPNGGTDRG